jgi:hypothetical protein
MTLRVAYFSHAYIKAAILFSVYLCAVFIAKSSWTANEPLMGTAVTIDLIFSIPLIYFLFIRRTSIPKLTVIPVFFFGVVTAYFALPYGERQLLDGVIAYAVPVVELGVLGYLGYRVYRTRSAFRAEARLGRDVMERLRSAFEREIKPAVIGRVAAFELALFYYVFLAWRIKRPPGSFTYHRSSGSPVILAAFLFLLIAETVVVHILVSLWSVAAAWILTALSLYLALQIAAHMKALFLRPIRITEDRLLLRCGVIGDTVIRLQAIRAIRGGAAGADSITEAVKLAAAGELTSPNITLELDEKATLNGPYGIRREFRAISFWVDEPEEFVKVMAEAIPGIQGSDGCSDLKNVHGPWNARRRSISKRKKALYFIVALPSLRSLPGMKRKNLTSALLMPGRYAKAG